MHLPVIAQYPKMKSSFFENSSHPNSQTRMAMIDGSDGYGEGTHGSTATPLNPGNNNNSNGSGKPRSKDPFDFAALKNQLPPNTGPPGTVATGGSSSNSKNLSHVPCKFFKQGVCQAGNSCPFSHNLDGSLGADKLPCKYFQKGNCKFGLKCALAHFLPDGTRINSKAIQNYRKSSNLNNKNSNNSGNNINNITNSIPNSNPNTSYGSNNTYYSTNGGSFSNSNSSSFIQSPTSQQFQLSVPQSQHQNDFILSRNRNSFSSQPIDIGNNLQDLPSPGNRIAKFVNLPYQQVSSHSQSLSQGQGGLNFTPFQTQGNQGSQGGQGGGHSFQGSQVGAGGILLPQPLSPRGGSFGSNDQYFNTGLNGGLFSSNNSNSFAAKTPMNRSYSFNTSPPSSGNNMIISNNFNPLSPFGQTPPGTTPSSYKVSQQPFSRLGTSNSSFSSTSYYYNNSTNLNDSAIADDEDDIRSKETLSAGKFGGIGDDFFCEEDYVPGSLSDLILTPLELQRRDSRSQSGTLLVRPNIKALFNDMKEEQEEGETGTDSGSSNIIQSPRAEKANLVHEDVFLME